MVGSWTSTCLVSGVESGGKNAEHDDGVDEGNGLALNQTVLAALGGSLLQTHKADILSETASSYMLPCLCTCILLVCITDVSRTIAHSFFASLSEDSQERCADLDGRHDLGENGSRRNDGSSLVEASDILVPAQVKDHDLMHL